MYGFFLVPLSVETVYLIYSWPLAEVNRPGSRARRPVTIKRETAREADEEKAREQSGLVVDLDADIRRNGRRGAKADIVVATGSTMMQI